MDRKGIVAALIAALFVVSAAIAQPAQPGDASAAASTDDGMKSSTPAGRSGIADADARLCLEFPTNMQVIMCAEKYRPKRRSA
jgi:hypothetical protein